MINKIKILRAEKGITQEELAEAVNVTRQTIIAIEKNKYVPSLELAFRIARYFDAVCLAESLKRSCMKSMVMSGREKRHSTRS